MANSVQMVIDAQMAPDGSYLIRGKARNYIQMAPMAHLEIQYCGLMGAMHWLIELYAARRLLRKHTRL